MAENTKSEAAIARQIAILEAQIARAPGSDNLTDAKFAKWEHTARHSLEKAFGKNAAEIETVMIGGHSGGYRSCHEAFPQQYEMLEATIEVLKMSIEKHPAVQSKHGAISTAQRAIDVFISHSVSDKQPAIVLCDLISKALKVSSSRIRCTSVAGHRLSGGADVADTLREEIRTCPVFLAILTEASDASAYVMAEIGARWMAGGYAVILRGEGFRPSRVRGPLADTHSFALDSDDDLHQLIGELGDVLGIPPERPEAYSRLVRNLVRASVPPDRRPTDVRDV